MEHEIIFDAGYWEWLLSVDGEVVYSFGDLSDVFSGVHNMDELESVADYLVDCMIFVLTASRDDEEDAVSDKTLFILKDNKAQIVNAIIERVRYEYAIF